MDWMTFMNPFMGLGTMASTLQAPGLMSPGLNQDLPLGYANPPPSIAWSDEGSIGGFVNPLAPGQSGGTNEGAGSGSADTDKGRAGADVSGAKSKTPNLMQTLKGVQAPAAPTPQKISSPNAPQMRAVNSSLAALLASMGVSPQQLRLGQMGGR